MQKNIETLQLEKILVLLGKELGYEVKLKKALQWKELQLEEWNKSEYMEVEQKP